MKSPEKSTWMNSLLFAFAFVSSSLFSCLWSEPRTNKQIIEDNAYDQIKWWLVELWKTVSEADSIVFSMRSENGDIAPQIKSWN